MHNVVVIGELPKRLVGGPTPNELLVRNELPQSTPTLHRKNSSAPFNAP